MISTTIYILGGLTAGIIICAVALLAYLIIRDAINSARFIWRVHKATKSVGEPIKSHRLLKAWFRYWVGLDWQPDYLIMTTNSTTIYWPGKEGSRRYPA